jgi:hypothetical protein
LRDILSIYQTSEIQGRDRRVDIRDVLKCKVVVREGRTSIINSLPEQAVISKEVLAPFIRRLDNTGTIPVPLSSRTSRCIAKTELKSPNQQSVNSAICYFFFDKHQNQNGDEMTSSYEPQYSWYTTLLFFLSQ